MKRYVIVGNGIAAVGVIEGIRSRDEEGEITVVSEEKHAVYGRPLISYYLEGKTDLAKMNYRPADFYEKNGCRVLYGKRAVALDPEKKTLTLDDGGSLPYDELTDRVLSSILDADCAAVVQKHLEENGIAFLLGDSVARFDEGAATMKSGKTVPFDLLVLAVGVRANTSLVKDAGGTVNRGIVVDERMKTTLPSVYAAGDCAEGLDASTGQNRVLAILPNAYLQGHAAGVNMAGSDETRSDAIPMNAIGFFGLHLMTAGAYDGEMSEEKTENGVKRFFVKDGLLRGFILIGETERAGIYTALIREKTPLSSLDFDLTKKVASNLIFSLETRRKKFGSVV